MMPTPASMPQLWVDDAGTGSSPILFATALAIACVIHLVLLLGVSFEPPESTPDKRTGSTLEIVVLRQAAPTAEKPETADALAQVDRVGGGMEQVKETDVEPGIEPEPEIPAPEPEAEPIEIPRPPAYPEPVQSLEPQPPTPVVDETLTATIEPENVELEPEPKPLREPESPQPVAEQPPPETTPPAVTAAQILASRSLEIAELTSRIRHSSAAYANRPRRKAISASTREYKYANYLDAWRRKVERVGNLNYPDEARRHKMYGNLILHAAIRADGSIEQVRVLRSSGFDVLDESAIKIVELAAPFAPFPPDIRAVTDILDITRTWQFLSSNRLGWEN